MNIQILSFALGTIMVFVGLFEFYSSSQRNIYIGIALIFYGIGTMMIATQKKKIVIVGLVLNAVTIVLSFVALIYERFG